MIARSGIAAKWSSIWQTMEARSVIKLVKAAANAAHQADNRKRKRKPAKAKV